MSAEALVIGGGPSGAVLATLLVRAGETVTLVEREAGPHDKVCGEFISGEAAGYLRRLSLDLIGLGAVGIDRVRLAAHGKPAQASLPFPAFSLSRRRLDEALLGCAAEAGVRLIRGHRVKGLERLGGRWRAEIDSGPDIRAEAAFLATGKHDLRSRKRPPGIHGDLTGFKTHLRLAPSEAAALEGAVELHLFPGGYAGLEPIEDGLANLCLVADLRRLGLPGFPGLLETIRRASQLLDRRLQGVEFLWPRPLAISAIPYGHVARSEDDIWRLGDQAAVIPSFAGDGLGIALHSAHAAASSYLAGGNAAAFQRRLAADLGPRVKSAALFSRLLVQPWAQGAALGLTRLRPQLLSAAAAYTRIPERALDRLRPVPVRPGTAGYNLPSDRGSDCPA